MSVGRLPTTELVSLIRQTAGITQEALARRLGVSFPTVNAWERGRAQPRPFHRAALDNLAQSLGILQGVSALVIDDDPDVGELIKVLLDRRDESFAVEVANSGSDGLLLCGAMQPDIVFLDLVLPGGIDGFEVAEALQRVDGLERTQVVFVTGQTEADLLRRARLAGSGHLLTKPFTAARFRAVIDAVLDDLTEALKVTA